MSKLTLNCADTTVTVEKTTGAFAPGYYQVMASSERGFRHAFLASNATQARFAASEKINSIREEIARHEKIIASLRADESAAFEALVLINDAFREVAGGAK
jgi:hypothetical protein